MGTMRQERWCVKVNEIIDNFILFVYKNPTEDIHMLLNRYVRSLTEEELKQINGMSPLLLETGLSALEAEPIMKKMIMEEIDRKSK